MGAIAGRSRKILRNIGGALLILLGITGLFLPFLQGIVFIIGGVALLDFKGKDELLRRGREHRWTRWTTDRIGGLWRQWRR